MASPPDTRRPAEGVCELTMRYVITIVVEASADEADALASQLLGVAQDATGTSSSTASVSVWGQSTPEHPVNESRRP